MTPRSNARLEDVADRPVLAVATANMRKVQELQYLLGDDVAIASMADFELESPDETGTSFEENALIKARNLNLHSAMVTLADDSGLEVDALGGQPGVRSARYAGDEQDEAANRARLLRELTGVPFESRGARFVTAIALVDVDGAASVFHGACDGRINESERGSGGFGYDPLFELPDGRTMAELNPQEKNRISHRAAAMTLALPAIRRALGLTEVRSR